MIYTLILIFGLVALLSSNVNFANVIMLYTSCCEVIKVTRKYKEEFSKNIFKVVEDGKPQNEYSPILQEYSQLINFVCLSFISFLQHGLN